jgi:hypothetical protein
MTKMKAGPKAQIPLQPRLVLGRKKRLRACEKEYNTGFHIKKRRRDASFFFAHRKKTLRFFSLSRKEHISFEGRQGLATEIIIGVSNRKQSVIAMAARKLSSRA